MLMCVRFCNIHAYFSSRRTRTCTTTMSSSSRSSRQPATSINCAAPGKLWTSSSHSQKVPLSTNRNPNVRNAWRSVTTCSYCNITLVGFVELWLDWIQDEMKIVDSDDQSDREKICRLFQRATKDYMCESLQFQFHSGQGSQRADDVFTVHGN